MCEIFVPRKAARQRLLKLDQEVGVDAAWLIPATLLPLITSRLANGSRSAGVHDGRPALDHLQDCVLNGGVLKIGRTPPLVHRLTLNWLSLRGLARRFGFSYWPLVH